MNNREKIFVTLGVGVTSLFLFFLLVINPLDKEIKLLDRKIAIKKDSLGKLDTLIQEYKVVNKTLKKMEARIKNTQPNVTLRSLLEETANRLNIRQKMTKIKTQAALVSRNRNYHEDKVKVYFDKLTLDELMRLVYNLETSRNIIKINGFELKTTYRKDPKYIMFRPVVSLFTANEQD